jgi:flagellar M-ring protein FliF
MPRTLIDQWRKLWESLSGRQRWSLIAAAILVAAGVAGLAHWNRERDFKPLFTNMGAEDAGAVVAKLKESGVEYRVDESGGAVMVRSAKVAETRLALASAGLPKTGRIGFELFDKTSLGTTDFVEQVNYRRALEGELERSIKSVAEVEHARVHLTFPKDSVFLESRLPAKASVLLRLKSRAQPDEMSVSAIVHLVASAVEGLAPESVAVMDVHGNLLNRPRKSQGGIESSDEAIEYRRRVEKDLIDKVNSTLEPLLGAGRFRTGMSVDCDFSGGEQSEETYDPEKSVMLNSTKTEETNSGGGLTAGVPGTSSNLPRGQARGSGSGGSGVTRRSETIAYQTSKTIRRVQLTQGSIKRISASILLDQANRWEQRDGRMHRVLVATPPETLRVIREVVSAAIGLNQPRGDQLVIESLPFDATLHEPAPEIPGTPKQNPAPSPWTILLERRIEAGIILALAAAAIWVVLRYGRRKRLKRVSVPHAVAAPAGQASLAAEKAAGALAEGSGKLLTDEPVPASRVEVLIESLRENIAQDPALAANVLRTWLDDRRN